MMENKQKDPIGVFDSGIGGLTVLREIKRHLPAENIIYLGDTARVPYGTRSAQTVLKYSRANTDFLLKQNIKLLIFTLNYSAAYCIFVSKAAQIANASQVGAGDWSLIGVV
jgi:glutamate racemase